MNFPTDKSSLNRIILISMISLMPFVVVCQSYVKEFIYNASDNESKIEARQIALKEVKRLLIEELGVYIHTTTTLHDKNGINNIDIETQVKVISECITKTEILEEKWDGEFYYIKVKLTVDEKDLMNRLQKISKEEEKLKKSTKNESVKAEENSAPRKKFDINKEDLYGALFGTYNTNISPTLGLSFGVITDNTISLGLYGEINLENLYSPENYISYINKGVVLELLFFNQSAINLSIPIKIGSGYLSCSKDKNKVGSDSFFIAEPSVVVGFRIKDSFRITGNIGFRITDGVEIQDVSENIVNGFIVGLAFKMIVPGL